MKPGKTSQSAQEVLGYFDAAVASYELAYQQFQEDEFQITKSLIRQIHAMMFHGVPVRFEPGMWRKGSITIAQAKVTTPAAKKVERLIEKMINQINKSSAHPIRKAATIHAFFEQIHPFPDGKGRTGRIFQPLRKQTF